MVYDHDYEDIAARADLDWQDQIGWLRRQHERTEDRLIEEIRELKNREYIAELLGSDVTGFRQWLSQPNGSHTVGRVTFEAVEGNGILVRVQPRTVRARFDR